MERWISRVAVVTGASSGIGAAVAKDLAKAGMVAVGLARRVERIEELRKDVPEDAAKRLHAIKCDISNQADIDAAFKQVEERFGGIDVLVNNAGIVRNVPLLDVNSSADIKSVVDTNVTGLVLCSQQAFQSMTKRSVDGHIINISSVVGHMVPNYPKLNVYPASKHAVKAITETMRQETRDAGRKVKVTSISPGGVRTEILDGVGLPEDTPLLDPHDISDAVLYTLATPPRVQIHEIIIKPAGERI
ncbi:farnesol dehydrogenase-like [Anopheles aquasalis]|uniref:farnesol dehydrogenase-like n=1 Tax=Anopheles aquasalis TaxID=42839 RepID=UPI00215A1BD9|nr:farnesol dehydrogenase-like [Anopheles aquasalis]